MNEPSLSYGLYTIQIIHSCFNLKARRSNDVIIIYNIQIEFMNESLSLHCFIKWTVTGELRFFTFI